MTCEYKGIPVEECEQLYQAAGLPVHIRAHCRAVGELSAHMAHALNRKGYSLNVELCRDGGYVHDICRLSSGHEKAAGIFLREKGYVQLAEVAERHRGFEENEPETICEEWVIVCLADKLIQEDKRVTLEQRYQKALEKKPIKDRILRDIRILKRLLKEYEVITGEQL
ncbi:MAG: HD domain-containing protein [Lachnospiraceae bacterium]|nr:HD domain-containing protein [Lachnospiraceae bacterium]